MQGDLGLLMVLVHPSVGAFVGCHRPCPEDSILFTEFQKVIVTTLILFIYFVEHLVHARRCCTDCTQGHRLKEPCPPGEIDQ